jgi:hypothetical protein
MQANEKRFNHEVHEAHKGHREKEMFPLQSLYLEFATVQNHFGTQMNAENADF